MGHFVSFNHLVTSRTETGPGPTWTLLSKLLGEPPAWPTATTLEKKKLS